jgi:hypothetical protein
MATDTVNQVVSTTQLQAPYLEDANRRLLASVQGDEGIPGLLNVPYENYNQLAQAGAVDPRLAPFAADQVRAFDLANQGVGAYQPYLDQAVASTDTSGAYDLLRQGSQYGPLDPYQNPYQTSVIDTTMQEMVRQQEMQQDMLDARAAQAQSFGGSRHGVAEAEMEKGHDLNRAITLSQLNQQGYNAAQAAQEAHRGRQIQAGLGMGQVGLDTARVQSGLGQLAQTLNQGDISTLGATGGMQQGQLQKQYDINYNQWLDEYQDPFRRAAFMSDIIKGVPSTQSSMTAGAIPQKSSLAQGIGALGQVASAGQQFGWWGNPANAS